MFMSMDLCQTQIHILINSLSINDNSNKVLEILSNLHSTLAKDFSSYLEMKIYWMSSPLTRSDRFLVDLFTTSIHTSPYPEYLIHDFLQ